MTDNLTALIEGAKVIPVKPDIALETNPLFLYVVFFMLAFGFIILIVGIVLKIRSRYAKKNSRNIQ